MVSRAAAYRIWAAGALLPLGVAALTADAAWWWLLIGFVMLFLVPSLILDAAHHLDMPHQLTKRREDDEL